MERNGRSLWKGSVRVVEDVMIIAVTCLSWALFLHELFMDFLKDRYNYLHFTEHEVEHQREKVICLRFSSSSVVELGFELGQLDHLHYATVFTWAVLDGCN